MRITRVFLTAAVLLFSSVMASAKEEPSRAQELFDQGLKDMLAGKYETGCPALEESYELDPAPGALFTLAECEAKWGHDGRALELYEDYVDEYDAMSTEEQKGQGERPDIARKQIDKLSDKTGRVVIDVPSSAPAGTAVEIDGRRVDAEDYGEPKPVDPGTHTVTVTYPGEEPREYTVEVQEGESRRVSPDPPEGGWDDDDDDDDGDGRRSDRWVFAEIAGGGGLGIPTAGFDLGPAFFLEGGALFILGPGGLAGGFRMGFQTYGGDGSGALPCPSAGPCVSGDGGQFAYDINEQALSLGFPVAYRFLAPDGAFLPYVGAIPTIYLVKATSTAYELDNTQTDTQFGITLLGGGQIAVGPGGILIEAGYQYAGLSHSITGETSLSAVLIAAGYRAML